MLNAASIHRRACLILFLLATALPLTGASYPDLPAEPGSPSDLPLKQAMLLKTPSQARHAVYVQPNPQIEPYYLPKFDRLAPADGLSYPIVKDVLQDSHGYMWFATAGGGLNRYDGYHIKVYRKDDGDPTSIPFDDVETLLEDSQGDLWIGGAAGLARFNRGDETFDHVDGRGQVFTIIEDREGWLWVGFWHGLYAYDKESGELLYTYEFNPRSPSALGQQPSGYIYSLFSDDEGVLWIGTGGGLHRFVLDRTTLDTLALEIYQHDPGDTDSLSHDSVRTLFEDSQDRFWVGTPNGLNLMNRTSGTFTRFQHDPGNPTSLVHNVVNAVLEDNQQRLWVATLSGLDRLETNSDPEAGDDPRPDLVTFIHHNYDPANPHSLSDDSVFSLYEDRSGLLWAATANGLSRYNQRAAAFIRYRMPDNIPSGDMAEGPSLSISEDSIWAFHEDRQGIIWIGGGEGGLYRFDPLSDEVAIFRHTLDDPTSLPSNRVNAIYEDRNGIMWIGTGDGSLSRFDRDAERFAIERKVSDAALTAITSDGHDNLWIGTEGDGLYRLNASRDTFSHYPHFWRQPDHWREHGSLSSHIIHSLYVDKEDVLWVGTYAGGINLWNSDEDTFSHYRHDPLDPASLGHDRVLTVAEDPGSDGEIMWVGTMGGGLNRLEKSTQTFTRFAEEGGLPGDIVGCMVPDANGFLWLSTVRGLSRFDPQTETFQNYDHRDGVPGIAISCLQSSTGELYFGTTKGFFSFDPKQIWNNPYAPPVAITELTISGQPVSREMTEDVHFDLSYEENSLAFEYAALDYASPERNRYAYILEGVDETWIDAGDRRRVEYTNLPPGDYTFRVKGSNNDGIWNETGTSLSLAISPPFWQTWWFRGVVMLLVVAAVFTGYRLRVRNLEARSQDLERQVEERTTEIARTNERLQQEIEDRARAEEELAQERSAAAVAAERGRLARELHDAVSQTLFSASLIAEVLPKLWADNQDLGRRQLEQVRLLTRGALAEMRTLLLELRPEALLNANMAELLSQLGRATTGRSGLTVNVTVDEGAKLPPPVQVAFYRIAQEALNNAAKHAQASQVDVHYSGSDAEATMVIQDDGRGFDAEHIPADHFGIAIIKERAAGIGAQLTITTSPAMDPSGLTRSEGKDPDRGSVQLTGAGQPVGGGTQIKLEWRREEEDGYHG